MAGELQYQSEAGANQGKLFYAESGPNAGKLVYECCCGGWACEYCNEGLTPESVTVEVTEDITPCPTYADPACLTNVLVTCTNSETYPCIYTGSHTCDAILWAYNLWFRSATTYWVGINYTPIVLPKTVFYYDGSFSSGECDTIDEEVANDLTVANCPPAGGSTYVGYDGKAQIIT